MKDDLPDQEKSHTRSASASLAQRLAAAFTYGLGNAISTF